MNVLWIKDNNIGHEKQVKVLLDELLKNHNLDIEERSVKGSFPFCRYINRVNKNYYDIIIGAGHKTYPFLLNLKKNQKKQTKSIAILTPTFKKSNFDIICAPFHDKSKFNNLTNVIFFEGSLAKVSQDEPDQKIIMVALGGKNKHYEFEDNHILCQIEYFLSLHPNKKCYIFNSRRTPNSMNTKIESLVNKNKAAIFCHFQSQDESFEEILHKSASRLITRDSVNMIYESLSCKGNTYLIDMKNNKDKNKVVKTVNELISSRKIGYVDCDQMIEGISKMKLNKQNVYNETYAEVEKVAYQLNKLL